MKTRLFKMSNDIEKSKDFFVKINTNKKAKSF